MRVCMSKYMRVCSVRPLDGTWSYEELGGLRAAGERFIPVDHYDYDTPENGP